VTGRTGGVAKPGRGPRAGRAGRWLPVLAALLGHWRRHPVQIATLLVGLAVATALWSGVQALNAEARASYARAAATLGGDEVASVVAADGGRFSVADHVALRREGWPVSPILEGTWRRPGQSLRVVGIDPVTLPAEATTLAAGTGAVDLVDFLTPPWIAIAAPETVRALAPAGDVPALVAADGLPPETLIVDIALAERLLDAEGRVSRLVMPPGEADRPLPGALADRLVIRAPEAEGELARLADSFHLNLTAFGFLSFVVGLLIVYAAIGLAFEERRAMLRTLRACGVSARGLTAMLVAELVALALVAGSVGMALGYAMAAALLPDVAASLRGLYGARVAGTLSLDPAWWAAGLGMSLAGAAAAAATSLWRAWSLPVLAPARPEAWLAQMRRNVRLLALASAAMAAAAAAALVWGEGIRAGFVLMGGVLLAAAFLLPVLIQAGLGLGARLARRPLAQWFWADGRQQLGGLSLALMALLLALAANIGVGTMVESFRLTFMAYLDQRLAPEIYVTAREEAQALEAASWLGSRPEVAAILPLWRAESRLADWPVQIYGIRDHATYRESWPILAALPDPWDRVAAGGGAMVSEQLARRAGLAPGDRVSLPTQAGPWSVEVAGIYPDYGNPAGQMMVSLAALEDRWQDIDRLQFGARAAPEAVPALLEALRARYPGISAVDQAEVMRFSRGVFERTFAVTVALNALTLAVAGIALLASLLALSGQRLGQVAPLWAIGIPRRALVRLEIGRALLLAAATALVALPLGLAVAWILTDVINVRAFGWRLPIHLFPADWARLFVMALAVALLAALLPVLRLARAEPADMMRIFCNER
jgi:putative ABC transport system permease protein